MEEDGRTLNQALRIMANGGTAQAREARYLEDRYAYLGRLSRGLVVTRAITGQGAPSPLVVTNGAANILYQILGIMKHVPREALRLKLRPPGGITLTLDFPRNEDSIITHRGSAVLLLEAPLPIGLTGVKIERKPSQEDAVAGGQRPKAATTSSRER